MSILSSKRCYAHETTLFLIYESLGVSFVSICNDSVDHRVGRTRIYVLSIKGARETEVVAWFLTEFEARDVDK